MARNKNTAISPGGTRGDAATHEKLTTNHNSKNTKQQEQSLASSATTRDQEDMLYRWLKAEPGIHTFEARRRGINHPAGRINSLRKRGRSIETLMINAVSQTGRITRIAFYKLQKSPQTTIFGIPGVTGSNQSEVSK